MHLSIFSSAQFSDKVLVGAISSISADGPSYLSALSCFNNPANLASIQQRSVSFLGVKPFGFSGWNASCISILGLGKSLKLGAFCWVETMNSYKRISMSSLFAKSLGPKMEIGVNFHIAKESIANYFSSLSMSADLGYSYRLSDKTKFSICLFDIVGARLNKKTKNYFAGKGLGAFSYRPNSKIVLSITVEKEDHQIPNLSCGFQYDFLKSASFQFGLSTNTQTYFSSFSFRHNKSILTLMESCHEQLGFTTGLQYTFLLTKNSK
jgi:hypothetical protein